MIQKGSETARQGIALQRTIRSNADRPKLGSVLWNRVTQRSRVRPGSNSLAYLTDGISKKRKGQLL